MEAVAETKKVVKKKVIKKKVVKKVVRRKKVVSEKKDAEKQELEKKIDTNVELNIKDSEVATIDKNSNMLEDFKEGFDEKTRLAYEIAKDHLETSFSLERCIAFKKYKKKQNT